LKYYLQKISVLLKHREYEQNVRILQSAVEQQGLCVMLEILSDTCSENRHDMKTFRIEEASDKQHILYLSDDGDVLRKLSASGHPVMAYFHEYNAGENFQGIAYGCEKPEELDAVYFDKIYRRCKRLPWQITETERCIIRETTVEDVDSFYQIYREPSITEYMESLFPEREQEIAYIEDYITHVYEFYDFGVWTVLSKETGEVIGRAGISYRDGCDIPELGFVIAVPWQRKGIAFEVCSAVLEYGRDVLGFETVQALVEEGNLVSLYLCEKLGFHQEEMVTVDDKPMYRMLLNPDCSDR